MGASVYNSKLEKVKYCYNLGLSFYAISDTHSQRPALKFPDGEVITYHSLNSLSNQIARFLLHEGLVKGDVIAIFNQKSVYAYSLMLACIKIGAIYTNIDISSPWLRNEKILRTCMPKIVFIDGQDNLLSEQINNSFPEIVLHLLSSDFFIDQVSRYPNENLEETLLVHGNDPVYIMFTSGSTGFPKGAVMSHNNVLNFIQWGRETFNVVPEDVFTNANPIYFDNSVFDFYTSLFNGSTLVPLTHEMVKDAKALVKAINDSGCTIWFSVPSLLVYLLTTKALSPTDFSSVTRISFGGEGFPKNKLKQLYELFSARMTLYNVYGPTECTCICSSYVVSEKDFDNMNELTPLGFIAPNFGYEILAENNEQSDFGELALLGPCVGLGYFNDAERTGKSFIQNRKAHYNQVMYKTGDLVERAANGYLHFKGRVDNQVKHMGYRIELEEIEAAFSTLQYIDEVAVIYEKINPELGQIRAFVSISDAGKESKHIVNEIRNILPSYMVPRSVSILASLPKNQNGKIDRKQLAEQK